MTTNMEYIQNGDYLIPNLALPAEETKSLGKYGMLRKSFEEAPKGAIQPYAAAENALRSLI